MSNTPCYIGFKSPSRQTRFIYCHQNGSPTDTGKRLLEHFPQATELNNVLDLGGILKLGNGIDDTIRLNKDSDFALGKKNAFEMHADEIAEMPSLQQGIISHVYLFDVVREEWLWCTPAPDGLLSYRRLGTIV